MEIYLYLCCQVFIIHLTWLHVFLNVYALFIILDVKSIKRVFLGILMLTKNTCPSSWKWYITKNVTFLEEVSFYLESTSQGESHNSEKYLSYQIHRIYWLLTAFSWKVGYEPYNTDDGKETNFMVKSMWKINITRWMWMLIWKKKSILILQLCKYS